MSGDSVSVRITPQLRNYVKAAALVAGISPREWLERAIHKSLAAQAMELALEAAWRRGECSTCGHTPCMCDFA